MGSFELEQLNHSIIFMWQETQPYASQAHDASSTPFASSRDISLLLLDPVTQTETRNMLYHSPCPDAAD